MAFHGSNAGVLVNGYDLSPFLNSLNDNYTVDTVDETCFGPLGTPVTNKSYIAGLDHAELDAAGKYVIDHAAGAPNQDQIADVLEAAIRSNPKVIATAFPFGDGFGQNCSGYLADEADYSISGGVSALVGVSTKFISSVGADGMQVVHPLAAEATTAGTNGTDLDAGATYVPAAWKGAVAHLHVLDVTGASPSLTAKVQHSVDGVTWADLIVFTAVTLKHKAQRLTFTGTVNRHLRAQWVVAAGSTVTFHLSAGRIPA